MPISLRFAVPLFLLLGTLIIAFYTLTLRTRETISVLESTQVEQVTRLTHRLQGTLEYLLRKGERARAQDELIAVTADPNVQTALIIDAQDKVVVSLHRANLSLPLAKVVPAFASDPSRLVRLQRIRGTWTPEVFFTQDAPLS